MPVRTPTHVQAFFSRLQLPRPALLLAVGLPAFSSAPVRWSDVRQTLYALGLQSVYVCPLRVLPGLDATLTGLIIFDKSERLYSPVSLRGD